MGFDRSTPIPTAAGLGGSVLWRRRSTLQVLITLSWVVGISASFLAVGIIGMFAADLPPIHLKTLADLDGATELPMVETSMAELQALEASEDLPAETEPVLPVEIPKAVETPPENLDLPEIAEAMTLEDVFAIPTAPKIEDVLRPVDPVVKPKPAPAPPRPRTPVASGGTPSTTPQAGSAGGTGTSGSGGKGKFPAPPYPTFARSGGMQGTVRLSISVGPSGAVEAVSIIGSTGFSALDDYAASWVRRNWRWPGGASNRYTLPLTFRLR
ncbi:energy transducer TonB [Prosthecobacter sp.]|uniref:energy transducer TonB n=1 Tax=Prosthecobacter sp. TaxID=1965333 RepID=UPI001E04742F|nr:energy transducer TonB [Prosthecobacter sp.]MCB1277558.1 TonB family protein [Prosthecobacter sp.]